MEFDMRRDFAQYFLPPDLSIGAFIARVSAQSLDQALQFYRDGTSGWNTVHRMVEYYFRGYTSEADEDAALALLLSTWRSSDIVEEINRFGWETFDDELDEGDLTLIARHTHQRLDHDHYRVAFLIRWFFLIEAESLPTRSGADLIQYATNTSPNVRADFRWLCISSRLEVINGIGHMALRGLPTFMRELRMALDAPSPTPLPFVPEIARLSWEAHYTDLICSNLERGEFRPLLNILPEMFDFNPPQKGQALFDMLRHWERHLVAMEALIAERGSQRQRNDMERFMTVRRTLMDQFPTTNPPMTGLAAAIAAAIAALQAAGNSLDELRITVLRLAEAVQAINAGSLLGTSDNEQAVSAINRLSQTGGLALLPVAYKLALMDRAFSGWVEDEEEDATLTVLRETKQVSYAEFMQLVAAMTWERLYNAIDGDQYDQLESMMQPA